jgi:hypothetical protein
MGRLMGDIRETCPDFHASKVLLAFARVDASILSRYSIGIPVASF